MCVFEYLRFNFKTQDFVMRLPIRPKSQIILRYAKCKVRWHNEVR